MCVHFPGPLGDEVQEVCLGWSIFPVFLKAGVGKSSLQKSNSFRLAMYEGTPRALFSLPRPTAGKSFCISFLHLLPYLPIDHSALVPIPGCILTVSLHPHPTLARASHILPPCILFTVDDIVPGLLPTRLHEGNVSVAVQTRACIIFIAAYPKLMKSLSCTLEKVCTHQHQKGDLFVSFPFVSSSLSFSYLQ